MVFALGESLLRFGAGSAQDRSVSKRSRSDATNRIAQVLKREVPVGTGRGRQRLMPQDALDAVRVDERAKHGRCDEVNTSTLYGCVPHLAAYAGVLLGIEPLRTTSIPTNSVN